MGLDDDEKLIEKWINKGEERRSLIKWTLNEMNKK